jgi:hypothetical protein
MYFGWRTGGPRDRGTVVWRGLRKKCGLRRGVVAVRFARCRELASVGEYTAGHRAGARGMSEMRKIESWA